MVAWGGAPRIGQPAQPLGGGLELARQAVKGQVAGQEDHVRRIGVGEGQRRLDRVPILPAEVGVGEMQETRHQGAEITS